MAANKKKRNMDFLYWFLFILYIFFLFYFLFFSEKMGRLNGAQYRYNLVPFREIRRFIKYREIVGWKSFFVNVIGNIIAFVPFGMLVPRLSGRRMSAFLVTLLALEFSFAAEVVQLIFKLGSFDVDDLILNTAGGLVGYLIYKWMDRSRGKHVSG
jgi:glycopeptide antibiotics resistance protein